jgi:ABC-type sugar transport system ATPase subunit
VAENIVFGLKVRRLEARKRNERLKSVAELVGLEEQMDR